VPRSEASAPALHHSTIALPLALAPGSKQSLAAASLNLWAGHTQQSCNMSHIGK
jgi:hypothetical protein